MGTDMRNDLDAAFDSYLRAIESIKADHPPLFRLSLAYGAFRLEFDCPNPLNKDAVKDSIILLTFVMKIFGAALFRLQIWSAVAAGLVVTFGVLPRLEGSQHAITG